MSFVELDLCEIVVKPYKIYLSLFYLLVSDDPSYNFFDKPVLPLPVCSAIYSTGHISLPLMAGILSLKLILQK